MTKWLPLVLITTLSFFTIQTFADQSTMTQQVEQQTIQGIDINHASVEELSSLKGIGNKKAQAIIKYREDFGKFTSIEDLLNVKGIGEKVLSDNLKFLKI